MPDQHFSCSRCGKEFDRIHNLKTHLAKKFTCLPLLSNDTPETIITTIFQSKQAKYRCIKCSKGFNSKSGLLYHKCKSPVDFLINKPVHQAPKKTPNGPTHIVNNVHDPDLSKISDDDFKVWIYNQNVFSAIKNIYFNPNIPENQSVLRKSIAENQVYVYTNDAWSVSSFTAACNTMIQTAINQMILYYSNHLIKPHVSVDQLDFTSQKDLQKAYNASDSISDDIAGLMLYSENKKALLREKIRKDLLFCKTPSSTEK